MIEPVQKTFAEWHVGDRAEFSEIITGALIENFAKLSGDINPIHTDEQYARSAAFGGTIAHGMLIGALFSRLIGMHIPGKFSLYLKQSLIFRLPISPGTKILVSGTVINKTDALSLLTVRTVAADPHGKNIFVDGEAMVKVLK